MYLIGYDIGSSSIKVAIIEVDSHKTVAIVQHPEQEMDMISRQSGWAEQQPEVWWQHVCVATRKLLSISGVEPKEIKGIGIGYQMHGLVLIDNEQNVLRPSIIWCDSRAVSIGDQAFREMGPKFCLQTLLSSPGNFTASKLKWVKDNEPEVYEKIHKVLLPGDYIAMKLTGEAKTTISGLSEGILWDFKDKRISERLLQYYDLEQSMFADIVPTFSIQGLLTKSAAEMTGLSIGTPVAYRAGDQPNNALALNVLRPGEIAATSGTSGVVYGIMDRPIYDEKSRVNSFAHVNYEKKFDRIGVLLCLNGAGIEYSWIKHQVARSDQSYADMERMVTSVPIGAEGVCILPFGNGAERIFENQSLNAHIFNLEFNRHTRGHLYRASLEGVAFSFVYGINILKGMGLNVDVIRVGNDNMFRSKTFATTLATSLGSQIEVVDTTGAVGAAKAAGVATGIYQSLNEALSEVQPSIIYEPSFNKAQCDQAYTYWLSCLEDALQRKTSEAVGSDYFKKKNLTLQKDLKVKTKELVSVSFQKTATDDFLGELKSALNEAVNENNLGNVKSILRKQILRIESNLSNQKDWEIFEENFNLLHSDFFKRLKGLYPELSISELKICALLKMGLTTKEISGHLNLSVRGVETRRYRLGKKIGLNSETNLASFISEF